MLTTADPRPLLKAAVTTLFAFGLLAAPTAASRGIHQCEGSLEIPQSEAQTAVAAGSIACLVNIERTSRGIPPLTRDADLARAARGLASDMSEHQFFAHVDSAGKDLGDRLRDAGYGRPGDGWYAGEDLGWGTGDRATPNALVDAWLNSSHHRRILLSSLYKQVGIGVAVGAPTATAANLPGATYAMDLATLRRG